MPAVAHRLALVLALGAGCAAPQSVAPASATPPRAPHAHPSYGAMAHALDRVAADAARCLASGHTGARVTGAFDGATGAFRAARVEATQGAALEFAARGCVRDVASRAHVRPFAEPTMAFEYAFAAPDAAATTPGNATAIVHATQSISTPIASGTTPAELVRRESAGYRACYEREALEREPTAGGTVEVRLVLDAGGAITRLATRAESTFPDPTLMDLVARCIEQRVRAIAFGPQRDPGTEVVVPLAFSPESAP